MKGAHEEEHAQLQELKKKRKAEMDRLISYMLKGVRTRIKHLKRGDLDKIICIEMIIASHLERWDLLDNLRFRSMNIRELEADIAIEEKKDYERRFNPLNSS
jgi:predicted outer membrane protein